MMNRRWTKGARYALALAVAGAAFVPADAEAQITRVSRSDARNQIVFNIGYFAVRGEDSRVDNDVLVTDLEGLAFDISDFNGATVGAEYLFGLSDYLEGAWAPASTSAPCRASTARSCTSTPVRNWSRT